MASDIRSRIGIDGEASYRQAIRAIMQDQQKLKKEMMETSKAFSSNASEQEKARTKSQQLTRQLDLANGKLKEQRDALKALEQDGKGASREAVNLRNSIKITEAEIANLNKELKQNSSLAAFGRDMQAAGKSVQAVGDKMSSVGQSITKGVTVPIVAAGAAAVKLAVDFESSIAKLDTIANSSEKSIGQLRSEIMALSDATGISASELAEQSYQAISAGRSTTEAVNFVSKATRLARAGFAETGNALDVLTTILNAYGKKESEVATISDQLILTQNLGKTTVGQLAEQMGTVIPTAAAFGVSLENLNSAYVTLTKQGINTAGATTRINGLLNQLGKSGTTSANVLKEKTGKSFSELMKEGWSLSDVLKVVKDDAEANGLSLSDMFGNIRAGQAALAIMNDEGVTFSNALQEMSKAAGMTDQAFAKLEKTTAFKFEKSLNRVKNTGIEAGQALLIAFAPTLERISKVIETAAKKFGSLSEDEQKAVVKTLAFAAAVGPATTALGKMTKGVGVAIEGAGKLAEKFGLAEASVTKMSLGGTAAILAMTAALSAYLKHREETTNADLIANKAINDQTRESAKLLETLKQERSEFKGTTDEITAKEKQANILVGTLDRLSQKTNKTADDEKRMQQAVAELNAIYPELNLSYDKNTGALSKNTSEIKKSISALKQQATATAYQDRLAKTTSDLLDVQSELAKAEKNAAAASDQLTRAQNNLGKSSVNGARSMSSQKAEVHALKQSSEQAAGAVKDLKDREAELKKEQESISGWLADNADATAELADEQVNAAGAAELMTESTEDLAAAMEEETAKIVEAGKLQAGTFEEVAEAQQVSLDEMMKGLQSQIDAYTNWSTNLSKASQYANRNSSPEIRALVDTIAKMGLEGAPYMQALVDAIESGSDDAILELARLNAGVSVAESQYEEGLTNYLNTTSAAMKKLPSSINKENPKVVTSAKQLAQGIGTAYKASAKTAGVTMYTDTATAAAKVPAAVRSKYPEAKSAGEGLPANVASGARSDSGIGSSGTTAAQNFINAVRAKYGDAKAAGAYMGQGLAEGIKSKASYINSTAANAASAAIRQMRNIAQVKSPSRVTKKIGGYISEGLALGMTQELPMVTSAANRIANAAIPNVNPYGQLPNNTLSAEEIYSAIRSGASESATKIFLNSRELTRGLQSIGVVFNES